MPRMILLFIICSLAYGETTKVFDCRSPVHPGVVHEDDQVLYLRGEGSDWDHHHQDRGEDIDHEPPTSLHASGQGDSLKSLQIVSRLSASM